MYMKKKSVRVTNTPVSVREKSTAIDEINKKLSSSAALNGGFDTLLYKIDKIEQSQGQLVNKVDKIHDAIYDPNDGIFSKLSEYKLESANQFGDVTKNVSELQLWKEVKEKEGTKDELKSDVVTQKVDTLERSVESLVRNKQNTFAVIRWFLVALGGGAVTLFIKWLENKI